jgi:hypothetical protein
MYITTNSVNAVNGPTELRYNARNVGRSCYLGAMSFEAQDRTM